MRSEESGEALDSIIRIRVAGSVVTGVIGVMTARMWSVLLVVGRGTVKRIAQQQGVISAVVTATCRKIARGEGEKGERKLQLRGERKACQYCAMVIDSSSRPSMRWAFRSDKLQR